jgi:hypothetical protein
MIRMITNHDAALAASTKTDTKVDRRCAVKGSGTG